MTPRGRAFAAFAVIILGAKGARADDVGPLERLLAEDLVTTASQSVERSGDAPATTSSISSDDLRRHGIRSVAEAINYLSLGMFAQVQWTQGLARQLGGATVGARGIALESGDNSHVLLLLDGHVINDGQGGASALLAVGGMPLELVDHIEIVLGPGSVLYGANAMLGVIHIVTKRAGDFRGFRVVGDVGYAGLDSRLRSALAPPQATWKSSYDALRYRAGLGFGETLKLGSRDLELTGQVQYTTGAEPGFAMGRTNADPRRALEREASFAQKLFVAATRARWGGWEAQLRLEWDSARRVDYTFLTPTSLRQDGQTVAAGFEDRGRRVGFDVHYTKTLSRTVSGKLRLFGDSSETRNWLVNFDGFRDCLYGQDGGCTSSLDQASYRGGAELSGTIDWLADGRYSTLVGAIGQLRHVEAALNTVDLDTGQNPGTEMYVSRRELGGALYAQQILRPVEPLSLNVGARFDYEQRFGSRLSPRAAANVAVWRGATLKAVYAEAFRGPTVQESYAHGMTLYTLPPKPLGPETVRSVELSLEQRIGQQRLLVGLFRSWWSNLVVSRQLHDQPGFPEDDRLAVSLARQQGELKFNGYDPYRRENLGSIDHHGVNLGYEGGGLGGRFAWGVNAAAAYARSTATGTTRPLELSPQFFGNARVSYDLSGALPTLALAAQVQAKTVARDAYRDYVYVPYAPPQLRFRATVSGPLPLAGLAYRVMGEVAFASTGPTLVDTGPAPTVLRPPDPLAPVDRYVGFVGLEYSFLP